MMGWGYGMMGNWFGMLIPLIFIGVIIYLVVRLIGHNKTNHGVSYDHSLDILKERYAKGEITEEEYKQKKAILMNK